MSNIAKAFIKAKKEFGKVLKVSTNPHFRNKYAPLDVCIESVDDACLNNGIAMYQETSEDESGITIETIFLHESGEALRCGRLHVPADKMNPVFYFQICCQATQALRRGKIEFLVSAVRKSLTNVVIHP